jgi:hypothetical protein
MTPVPNLTVTPPLPVGLYARRPARKLPFPLEEPTCRIFALARQGLFVGIKALGLMPGDVILVPAYNHGSEIERCSERAQGDSGRIPIPACRRQTSPGQQH